MVIRKLLERFRRPAEPKHVIEDELFGDLTWDEGFHSWSGIMTMASGKTASITIEGVKTDESISEAARNSCKFLIANEPRISDKIAASMSEFYNESWGNGDTMTADEMAQRINLTGVHIYDEGGGQLYYTADDYLFTDHTICAYIDEHGEIDEPGLEG